MNKSDSNDTYEIKLRIYDLEEILMEILKNLSGNRDACSSDENISRRLEELGIAYNVDFGNRIWQIGQRPK